MAAGVMPAPGTEYGPCEDECQHRDCAATRERAAFICRYCGEPIGYDTRFYIEGRPIDLLAVHALCAELEEGR